MARRPRGGSAVVRTLWVLLAAPPVLGFLWVASGCSLLFLAPEPHNAQSCACTCELPRRGAEPRVGAPADDAREQSDSNVTLGGSELVLGRDLIGLRFPELQIPRGATIHAAHVQFTASSTNSSTTEVRIHVIRSNEPFVNQDGNLSDRIPVPPPGVDPPLTVTWTIPPWTSGDGGLDQRTPDLTTLVSRELGAPWQAGDGLVVLLEVVDEDGTRRAHSFEGDPEFAAVLHLEFSALVSQILNVCMPEDMNPNLAPGGVQNEKPSQDDINNYCEARVAATVGGLANACFGPGDGALSDAISCRCRLNPDPKLQTFSKSGCDRTCDERPLSPSCVELDPSQDLEVATHAPGDEPVCLAEDHPDDPMPQALSRGLFGRRSECLALGTATASVGSHSDTRPVLSRIWISGEPCPGATCDVGVSHVSPALEDFRFGGFLGFGETRVEGVIAAGASAPASASLDATGAGVFPAGQLQSTVWGTRDSTDEGAESATFEGSNVSPLPITVNWATATCAIEAGELEGVAQREGEDPETVTIRLDLAGGLLNRPPTAVATVLGSVECAGPDGAEVVLDGSASSDPDGNLVELSWRAGGRMGPEVAHGATASLVQGLGAESYVLRIFDAFGRIDEAEIVVEVEDTTPPEIACNAPSIITPPDAPISFTATAQDTCDAHVAAEIAGVRCFEVKRNGRVEDKSSSCVVAVEGATFFILDSGGVNTQIEWDVRAVDSSGNETVEVCGVHVVRAS